MFDATITNVAVHLEYSCRSYGAYWISGCSGYRHRAPDGAFLPGTHTSENSEEPQVETYLVKLKRDARLVSRVSACAGDAGNLSTCVVVHPKGGRSKI